MQTEIQIDEMKQQLNPDHDCSVSKYRPQYD